MRKFLVLLFVSICQSIYADNYKILQMNASYIQIGRHKCKQGDSFSDEDRIKWSSDKEAIKAMNLRTRQIKIFVSEAFSKAKAKSVKEFFLKSNHLSTRGGVATFSDLAEELSDTLYILGSIPIESPVPIDSISSYVISYEDGGTKWRNLMSTEDTFFLSSELFNDNQKELTLSLFYRRKGSPDFLITDKLVIILLPQNPNDK